MRHLEKSERMGSKMKLPKIEKKHLIAGGTLTAVAVVAFAFGSMKSPKTDPHAETANQGEHAVAVAKPAHEPDEGKPATARVPERAPAASPKKPEPKDENDDYYEEEEEVDTQIAHALPHGKNIVHSHEKRAEAETKDTVVETESAPAPVEDHRGILKRLFDTYVDAWESVNAKIQAIKSAEEENKKLKLENAYLRVMVESGKFNARSEEAKKATETVGKKLVTAAGSRAARSIASIHYQFPENLLPEQLLALGVSYFKVKDDEKAAVILNFLTELDDDQSFRTAPNYLMAGIAFYRLEHYKNAADYFERVGKLTETDAETMKAKRQAVYWRALVAERMKNRGLAQKLILDSLEQDPLTEEARWVNPQDETTATKRAPASEKESEESHEGRTSRHH